VCASACALSQAKLQLPSKFGVPAFEQQLFCNGKLLTNGDLIKNGVTSGAALASDARVHARARAR
jgi:hypothetical protein